MMRMRWTWLAVAGLVGSMWASDAQAREVLMYARSNGDWKSYTQPGKYSALNLVDKAAKTAWCSEGSGAKVSIEFQFSGRVAVDRIGLLQGHPGAFSKYNRVRRIEVSDGDMMTQAIEVADSQEFQSLDLEPPVESDRIVIKFLAGYPGSSSSSRHTCLSDIVFFDGNTPLNGPKLAKHLKKAKANAGVLDTWVSGPEGMKNRRLILGLDGTYRFKFMPSDPVDQPLEHSGPFRVRGGTMMLKQGRDWVSGRVKKDDAGRVLRLEFSGKPFGGSYIRRLDAAPLR